MRSTHGWSSCFRSWGRPKRRSRAGTGSEERVDERRHDGTREAQKNPEQEQDDERGREPPLLVRRKERKKTADRRRSLPRCQLIKGRTPVCHGFLGLAHAFCSRCDPCPQPTLGSTIDKAGNAR